MACFFVPVTEAVVTTIAGHACKAKEAKSGAAHPSAKLPFSRKLKWLSNLLWGGSALLAFEHLWHGELVPWFPFLTGAGDPSSAAEMLHEMSTAGVAMAVLVTAVWGCMVGVTSLMEKRAASGQAAQ